MASTGFETGHADMIHDAQLDYYGKRLATASSDRTIKIFDVVGDSKELVSELKGHDGPVWQVAWAHPKFGNLLASCSYDGRVIVWKESTSRQWAKVYIGETESRSSVNAIAWGPHTFELVLAAACADGSVSVFTHQEASNTWAHVSIPQAHKGGTNSVSWAPDVKTGSVLAQQSGGSGSDFVKRFVTSGCDNRLRIWRFADGGKWVEEKTSMEHKDWVRDAAWAPSLGLPSSTIASCSEDQTVAIWTAQPNGSWTRSHTMEFPHKVWRVSWSIMGNILAVSQGDSKVSLWKESVDGTWKDLSKLAEGGPVASPAAGSDAADAPQL